MTYHGEDLGVFRLPSPPGIHNVRNAAAAAAVGLALNVPADLIRAGLAKFSGVGRRFEIKGVHAGVTLIDDYGHHPAEIRATLEAARGCGYKRLLVLFQPHRYTRTHFLWDDFLRSFNEADVLVVTDIYAAGEAPIAGVTGERLAEAIRSAGHKNVTHSSHHAGRPGIHAAGSAPWRRHPHDRRGKRRPRARSARAAARIANFDFTCGLKMLSDGKDC